jgi:hypothetical protein
METVKVKRSELFTTFCFVSRYFVKKWFGSSEMAEDECNGHGQKCEQKVLYSFHQIFFFPVKYHQQQKDRYIVPT